MQSRSCQKCGAHLPLTEFYPHPKGKGGFGSSCKECVKAAMRMNRAAKIDRYREYDRARANRPDRVEARRVYQKTPAGMAAMRRGSAAWNMRNPDKKKASTAIANAIRDKRLKRWPCQVCGAKKSEAHHPDYSAPLAVVWLCRVHHAQLHREFAEMNR